jgi:hypothetical protein
MMDTRLLSILTHSHIPEGGLARKLYPVHQDANAAGVSNNLAGRTFHPGAMFLKRRSKQ